MRTDSSDSSLRPSEASEPKFNDRSRFPKNWKEAIPCLISSRLGIFQIEAQDALAGAITKILLLGAVVICLVATWILMIAGLIGLIAAYSKWEWFHAAFAIASVHLVVAIIIFLISRSKVEKPFPITCAEFKKDREWLDQLKNQSSSES